MPSPAEPWLACPHESGVSCAIYSILGTWCKSWLWSLVQMHEVLYVWLRNCWNNMEKICCRNKLTNHHRIQQQKRIAHSDNVLTKTLKWTILACWITPWRRLLGWSRKFFERYTHRLQNQLKATFNVSILLYTIGCQLLLRELPNPMFPLKPWSNERGMLNFSKLRSMSLYEQVKFFQVSQIEA